MSVIIGGIYEHYKKKKYKVIGIAKNSETLEKCVVYQALYGTEEIWIRPYDMFCEKLEIDGKEVERFIYLGNELEMEYKINLELSNDLYSMFLQNGIDIERELAKEIKGVKFEHKSCEGDNKKDIALTVLAIGASVSSVLLCVVKMIRAVNERPREATIFALNAEGTILKKEKVLLEPKKSNQRTELDFEVGTGSFKIKIADINIEE